MLSLGIVYMMWMVGHCTRYKGDAGNGMVMMELLSELIGNRCVNPPGGEMRSIDTVRRYLRRRGVDCVVYESAPGRGNLVAEMPGTGGGPRLMFGPGHVDVAPVEKPGEWTVDPFGAEVRDGYVWGRGSHDMLFMVAAHVQAFADLSASGFTPRGGLTLLLVCDEEDEGAYGTGWMMENHPEALQVDYAVSEAGGLAPGAGGGGVHPRRGGRRLQPHLVGLRGGDDQGRQG